MAPADSAGAVAIWLRTSAVGLGLALMEPSMSEPAVATAARSQSYGWFTTVKRVLMFYDPTREC